MFRVTQKLGNPTLIPSLKMSTTRVPKKYFILNYKYDPTTVLEKRAPLRNDHLSLAKKWQSDSRLVMGGAFADPIDGAVIVFKVGDKSEVEEFVRADPYVNGGLVTSWDIREWTVVIDGTSTN